MKLALSAVLVVVCLFVHGQSNGTWLAQNPPNSARRTSRPFQLQPCHLPNRKDKAKCGKYEVFQDRETGSRQKIALNVLLLPALNVTPVADPVFFIAGGPGQS